MKVVPKILYLLCFVGLTAAVTLSLNRAVEPAMSDVFLRAVIATSLAAAPGLVYRKAWPAALILLPIAGYLVIRSTIPLPSTVEGWSAQYAFYLEHLREGGSAYLEDIFPLKIGDVAGLRLLVAVSVYVVVAAASFLALSLRKVVPALVLLVVLLGFSLTVDIAGRALWLAVLFLVLGACMLVLSRGLQRSGWRVRDTLAGGVVGGVAALLALLLLGAAPSTVASPWQDWRTWDPFRHGGSSYTFNWMQNYPRLLDPANDHLIMRVESPAASYWRANALDTFTGSAWVTSVAFPIRTEPERVEESWAHAIPPAEAVPPGEIVDQAFQIQSVYTNYIFTGGEPLELRIDQDISLRLNDMRSLHVARALGPALAYSLTSVVPDLDPDDVVDKGWDYPEGLEPYLALPFPNARDVDLWSEGSDGEVKWQELAPGEMGRDAWEWRDLYTLNREVVGEADDPYDITLRIERHLRRQFDYSLAPPGSEFSSPYAAFLFDTHSGYCQHFAGAMALLLRYNGVPARVAVGFTTGEKEADGVYLVSTGNAHAWVEVYFPTVGWVAFDPTPGRNIPAPGPSSTSPGFINPFVDRGGGGELSTVTTEPRMERNIDRFGREDQPGGARGSSWHQAGWLPWLLGLLALAAAWPVGRSVWRRRDLYRGTPEERLAGSLKLLHGDLAAFGVPTSPGDTTEDIVRLVEVHLDLAVELDFVDRAQAILFGDRRARREDLVKAEVLRRRVRDGLRRRHGWFWTVMTWYGLSSTLSRRARARTSADDRTPFLQLGR